MPYYQRDRSRSLGRGRGRGRGRSRGRGMNRQTYRRVNNDNSRSYDHNNNGVILNRILNRLEKLENRSRSRNDNYHDRSTRNDNRRPAPRRDLPARDNNRPVATNTRQSDNPDFKTLVRESFRYAQVAHHQHNWRNCPKSIATHVDKIVQNIKPPHPTDQLQDNLKRAADDFKSAITAEVQNHLQTVRSDTANRISRLNKTDLELASDIARKQLNNRLGRRLHQPSIQSALDEIKNMTSTTDPKPGPRKEEPNRRPIPRAENSTTTPGPSTHNRFQPLTVQEDDEDDDDDIDVVPPTNPNRSMPKTAKTAVQPRGKRQRPNNSFEDEEIAIIDDPAISAAPLPVVRVHVPEKRTSWRIDQLLPGVETVVIADSNGQSWADTSLPEGWTIDAFRGARLQDAANLLKAASTQLAEVENVVIAVGINDRDSNPDVVIANLQKIKNWGTKYNKKVFFTSVPIFPLLPASVQQVIRNINSAASDLFGNTYVASVNRDDIELIASDITGIHYTAGTAALIVNNIMAALN